MKNAFQFAILALLALPAFPQNQAATAAPRQLARPRLSLSTGSGDNVLAQIADGQGWQTTITVFNLRATPTTYSIDCYGGTGQPQAFPWSGMASSSSIYGSLAGSGETKIQTSGTASALTQGWCYVDSPGDGPNPSTQAENDVGAFAIYTNTQSHQEVSVTASPWYINGSLVLAFDNTNGYAYGVALADSNFYPTAGEPNDTVSVEILDQNGNEIGNDSFPMVPRSNMTFMLATKYPVVANQQGTIIFTMSMTGGLQTLAGLGLRAAPLGSFTSVDMFQTMNY